MVIFHWHYHLQFLPLTRSWCQFWKWAPKRADYHWHLQFPPLSWSWCQFWKFLQPNCPLLSYLPSYWRHLCAKLSFFFFFSFLVEKIDWISIWGMLSPFCPNQSHSSSRIRKTLPHPFSQTYQCHIKLMMGNSGHNNKFSHFWQFALVMVALQFQASVTLLIFSWERLSLAY